MDTLSWSQSAIRIAIRYHTLFEHYDTTGFVSSLAQAMASQLAPWFATSARSLDWRKTRNPYCIWISEIMLQQTRVDTVTNYYSKFLSRFPDVETLACADEDDVLKAWSGLGYYRRARMLHQGAQHIATDLAGNFPRSVPELRKIPGVGPYTAGAIVSIAYDQPAALVDGNVARVLSRVILILEKTQQGATNPAHWTLVDEILGHGSPRILAQALMELGALICTPRIPKCGQCPLQHLCQAKKTGLQGEIPAPKKKTSSSKIHYIGLAVRWGQKLMLEKRQRGILLEGLWCLPLMEYDGASSNLDISRLESTVQFPIRFERLLEQPIKHVFSHRVWQITIALCRARRRQPRTTAGSFQHWIVPGEVPPGGLPAVTRKLLSKIDFDSPLEINSYDPR